MPAEFPPADDQALLLREGDRLAADLALRLGALPAQEERVQFIGRTLAVNLVRVFVQTLEDVTRKVGRPLRVLVVPDALERPELLAVNADGEVRERIPADELLNRAFYQGARLHPAAETHLRAALAAGNEHLATRHLVACLKTRAVLEVSLPYLGRLAR